MMRRMLAVTFSATLVCLVTMWHSADAQMRKFTICAPDYSVGTMPLIIAKKNGYFAKEHLDVEVIAARGNLCTMALISDSVQFTFSPSTFDAVVAGDVKGKVIYVAEKFLLHRFIVAPQIKSFEDLKGKKIAISSFGSLTDLLTREILTNHGLKPMKDVLLLQTGSPSVRYAALQSGQVQGALLSSQQALTAMKEGYRNLKYTPPPYVSHPLIAKDEMLRNDPADVRGLLLGVLKGHIFFGERPDDTVSMMQKVLRIDNRKQAEAIYKDEMRRYNPGGQFEQSSMKKVIERAREARKIDRKVEIQDAFDLSMAAKLYADLKKSGWKP